MFGVARRRVASVGTSSLLGQSGLKFRSGPARVSSILEKEVGPVCMELAYTLKGVGSTQDASGRTSLVLNMLVPFVPANVVVSLFHLEGIAISSGGCGNIRNFCHIIPGRWINSKPISDIFHQEASIQTWKRSFSSDSGDNVDVVVPPLAESIEDGTLAKFLKRPGDRVNVDEPIAQIETDKVTIDVTSPESGVILKLLANEGDTVEPGHKIAIISRSADATHVAPSENAPEKPAPKPTPKASEPEKKIPKVETTPKASEPEKPKAPAPSSSPSEPQLPPKDRERRVLMTRLRKRVAIRLKDAQNTYAMLTTFNEVDM
ncbi:dihydrolipoyllysine-residue succinyltransferase component of 2-oxoglutarate dehydrogenase complex mitochondrial-like protein [Trifolium pratense]|uniref:Dihydrolipoyllysine-residue succinyltransferase component of 2-oxoglutarate dehydrogenase complex mitochondrial-like protein n=1 Tax=Trifolium pratense TaxID=57577 RepID=A0A2K3N0U5_TRIPR|nr:dihydrolipoyllysine-residue succinyltransferase component of 2-oxoglutarate dehydrogenase complex mitochondrial-like protein [Trifolium pratense]